MIDRGESLALEIQRLLAETKTNGVSITALEGAVAMLTPTPAPFAGAGTGDGIVGDPGGSPGGTRYLDDTGSFSVPAGTGGGGSPYDLDGGDSGTTYTIGDFDFDEGTA